MLDGAALRAVGRPAKLNDEQTGFECYLDDGWETIRFIGASNFDHIWKYALGLRWLGTQMNELYSAWMAATAYAKATDGIILTMRKEKSSRRSRRAS